MSWRADILASLSDYIPEGWDAVDYTENPGDIQRPIVMCDIRTIRPGATFGALAVDAAFFLLHPAMQDAKATADALDDALLELLPGLFRNRAGQGAEATPGTFPNTELPCWQITLSFPINFTEE